MDDSYQLYPTCIRKSGGYYWLRLSGQPHGRISQLPEKVPVVLRDRPDHQVLVQKAIHALTVGFAQLNAAVAAGVVEVPPVVLVQAADRGV